MKSKHWILHRIAIVYMYECGVCVRANPPLLMPLEVLLVVVERCGLDPQAKVVVPTCTCTCTTNTHLVIITSTIGYHNVHALYCVL